MTMQDVIDKINQSTRFQTMASEAFCAVCYKRSSRGVIIHEPHADNIPLCPDHYRQAEPVIRAREATKHK